MARRNIAPESARAPGDAQWSPGSWRARPVEQAPAWPDEQELKRVLIELEGLPGIVDPTDVRRLTSSLGEVAERRAIVLQAGDCAESFADANPTSIRDRLAVILQMAVVLAYGSGLPVVRVGRIAGQYAKPRSSQTERFGGLELPSFRGDMVNEDAWNPAARTPDPRRMLTAYRHSTATLAELGALTSGGFASLHRVHTWNKEFVASTIQGRRYEEIAAEIDRALAFIGAIGMRVDPDAVGHAEVYTSHEALLLEYEEALTRRDPTTGLDYSSSAHMLWVGDRTRQLDGAHVEFARGIENPIGIKLGPTARPDDVVALCAALNPDRVPGRLTLITRFGVRRVEESLPGVITAVEESGHPVVWQCDPMHGNTFFSDGRKTRRFDDVLGEIRTFFAIHRQLGTWPAGIHVELTGDDVTECLGGVGDISEEHLSLRYTTACDPRLNARQALDLAFRVAELLPER